MTITVLNDNACQDAQLESEHGLSIHIETEAFACLFDFGQSERWFRNAVRLGVDAAKLDFAVLSHGHYDHAGGAAAYLDRAERPRLFRAERCWETKGSLKDGVFRDLGIPDRQALRARLDPADEIGASCSPLPGVHLLLPESQAFSDAEPAGQRYVVQANGSYRADEFMDEITLVVEEAGELAVFTGCAHRGVFAVVDQIREAFPRQRIAALVGGFHLRDQSDAELRTIARGLSLSGIRQFYPCHCSGERAVAILAELMPHRVSPCRTGSRFQLLGLKVQA